MKQITLLQGKALLIELPEGAISPRVYNKFLEFDIRYSGSDGNETEGILLPPGTWQIVGMLSEVTDAELADVTGFYYNKYNERYVEMPTSAMRATPIGDIEDAIRAEGFTFQNNLRNPDDVCYFSRDRMIADVREYHEVQSRVLCRERCLLLGRVDG